MAKKSKRNVAPEIVRTGKQILIPPGMSFNEAIDWMAKRRDEEKAPAEMTRIYNYHPLEVAHALGRAIDKVRGFHEHATYTVPGFFGDAEVLPTSVDVPLSTGGTIKVPIGRFVVPGLEGWVHVDVRFQEYNAPGNGFLRVKTIGKDKADWDEILDETQKQLEKDSLFAGQAFYGPGCAWMDQDGDITGDPWKAPRIVEMPTDLTMSDLILRDSTYRNVAMSVFTPVQHPDACRMAGIPPKRGILLYGPYGTGKTLTGTLLGKLCVAQNRTFMYVDDISSLSACLQVARRYKSGAVIFCEDIDRVRDNDEVEVLRELLDGVEAKGMDIMTVFTTNHPEQIHESLVRKGRLDAKIHFPLPDTDAAERLIRKFAGTLLDVDEDLMKPASVLAGHTPASIREAVDRAKLAAIEQRGLADYITAEDIHLAAIAVSEEDALEARRHEHDDPDARVAEAIGNGIGRQVAKVALKWNGPKTETPSLSDESDVNPYVASKQLTE